MRDVLSREFENLLSASIAFDQTNANGLSPNPYNDRRENKSVRSRNVLSFLLVKFLLTQK